MITMELKTLEENSVVQRHVRPAASQNAMKIQTMKMFVVK